jgi:hypothetical protein
MILGIPLFRDLFERLGDTFDRNQFFIHLGELASVDRDVAVNESGKIRNLYEEALPYIRKKTTESKAIMVLQGEKKMETGSIASSETASTVGQGMIRLEIFGKPPIVVPDKKHYVQSLIQDLQEHLHESPKDSVKKDSKGDA